MRPDAIIIGGSFAGLSAAMYIARVLRSVCIVDTGSPRNRFAAHSWARKPNCYEHLPPQQA
jgi:thioredoxin reductase